MRLGSGHHEHVWAARYSTDEAACRNGLWRKNIRLAHCERAKPTAAKKPLGSLIVSQNPVRVFRSALLEAAGTEADEEA